MKWRDFMFALGGVAVHQIHCALRRGDRVSFAELHESVHGTSRHFVAMRNLVAIGA
jgi:hypothetical protein